MWSARVFVVALGLFVGARCDSCAHLFEEERTELTEEEAITESAHFWCERTEDGVCEKGVEDAFSDEELRELVSNVTSSASPLFTTRSVVNPSTIKNKVLSGYQGWVGAEGDTISGYGWRHWFNGNTPSVSKAHFEMLPELGEYPSNALYDTELKYVSNGSTVKLFSNAGQGVVDLHFSWMEGYGLDGVLLQRFLSEVTTTGITMTQRNTILAEMDAAAAKYGRTYAVMWDMSGATSWEDVIKSDFQNYIKKYVSSPRYLKEDGKPVVCIFGIGLSDRTEMAPPDSSLALIRWLQDQGLYVIGSGPYYWRTGGHDAGAGYDAVHAAFDAIMPWSVGRYNTVTDFKNKQSNLEGDAAMTSARSQGYAPIAYAGYSYRDSHKFNFIKRNGGQFFKAQIDSYLSLKGATFYYVAMFDEVQEGTAIYKMAANEDESAQPKGCFVTMSIDGVDCPGDFYLKMTGQFTSAAHGRPSPSPSPPSPPSPPPPSPSPPGSKDSLGLGDELLAGNNLVSSAGNARMEMQASDGNLVLYSGQSAIWSSTTAGHPGAHLAFQTSDGNLVLYDGSKALWSTGPQSGAVKVTLTNNCDLVVVDGSGKQLWSLGTHCDASLVV